MTDERLEYMRQLARVIIDVARMAEAQWKPDLELFPVIKAQAKEYCYNEAEAELVYMLLTNSWEKVQVWADEQVKG